MNVGDTVEFNLACLTQFHQGDIIQLTDETELRLCEKVAYAHVAGDRVIRIWGQEYSHILQDWLAPTYYGVDDSPTFRLIERT